MKKPRRPTKPWRCCMYDKENEIFMIRMGICKTFLEFERSWRAKTADCNPSIVLWGRNFKPYKKFLPYFIFIKLLAQEVRICSEIWFVSKWNFFSYEFSTFFDLFAKNNSDVRGRTLSFFCLFFKNFQSFRLKNWYNYIILVKLAKNGP